MDKEDKISQAPRVRFGEQRLPDEEDGYVIHERAPSRSRRNSIGNLSIHSTGGTRIVQPETALPITYRTLSIEIDEGQQKKQDEVKKAKEKAAIGTFDLFRSRDTISRLLSTLAD
jgi:sodium/potassium-transporting ATPase subunit alpha